MKIGDIVKYSAPQFGEADIRFVLRELNGDRVLLQFICDLPIPPLETVSIDQIEGDNQ